MCYLLFPVPKAGFARRTGKILEERIQSSCGDVEDASTQMRRGEALLKCLPQKDYVVAVGDNDKSWLIFALLVLVLRSNRSGRLDWKQQVRQL